MRLIRDCEDAYMHTLQTHHNPNKKKSNKKNEDVLCVVPLASESPKLKSLRLKAKLESSP